MPEGVGYPAPPMQAQAQMPQGQRPMGGLERILMMLFGADGGGGNELDQHMRGMQGRQDPQRESEEEAFRRLQQEQNAAKGALGSLGR